jgi:hypothetical protein
LNESMMELNRSVEVSFWRLFPAVFGEEMKE